jgi:uncharacterized membrane protein
MSWVLGLGTKVWLYLGLAAAILGTIFAILRGQRAAGRAAERVSVMKETLDVKVAQQKAAAAAPRDTPGVVKRLRDGKF